MTTPRSADEPLGERANTGDDAIELVQVSQNQLILFTKAPELGNVKTRLAAEVGAARALEVHNQLVTSALKRLCGAECFEVVLCVTKVNQAVKDWANKFTIPITLQPSGDLGARMYGALATASAEKVVLVGSDCPDIDSDYVKQAFETLEYKPVVFGPAEDGGYGLIGVRQSPLKKIVSLFEEIPWGGDQVFEITTKRLERLRIKYGVLPTIWDVDVLEDWQRLLKADPNFLQ